MRRATPRKSSATRACNDYPAANTVICAMSPPSLLIAPHAPLPARTAVNPPVTSHPPSPAHAETEWRCSPPYPGPARKQIQMPIILTPPHRYPRRFDMVHDRNMACFLGVEGTGPFNGFGSPALGKRLQFQRLARRVSNIAPRPKPNRTPAQCVLIRWQMQRLEDYAPVYRFDAERPAVDCPSIMRLAVQHDGRDVFACRARPIPIRSKKQAIPRRQIPVPCFSLPKTSRSTAA